MDRRLQNVYRGIFVATILGMALVGYALYRGLRGEDRWWMFLPVLPAAALGVIQLLALWRAQRSGAFDEGWLRRTRQVLIWSLLAFGAVMIASTWR